MARYSENTREIGARVRARRDELGLTQEALALRCGYSNRSSINKIENGGNALNMDTIRKLADALDVPVSWLIGEENTTTADVIRQMINDLTPAEQETVLAMIKGLVNGHYD